jgi:hypothetical protein
VPTRAHYSNSPFGHRPTVTAAPRHWGFDNNCGYQTYKKDANDNYVRDNKGDRIVDKTCRGQNNHYCGNNHKIPIVAAGAGTVERREMGHATRGNNIAITHANGMRTEYWHLHEVTVAARATVSAGQPIGTMGNTGNSEGAHLHFEMMLSKNVGTRFNPLPGYHWQDSRSGQRNPNPMFICTICGDNAACRGRDIEGRNAANRGNHNFVHNPRFDPAFFDEKANEKWWTIP